MQKTRSFHWTGVSAKNKTCFRNADDWLLVVELPQLEEQRVLAVDVARLVVFSLLEIGMRWFFDFPSMFCENENLTKIMESAQW